MFLEIDSNNKITGIFLGTFPAATQGTIEQVTDNTTYRLGDTFTPSGVDEVE